MKNKLSAVNGESDKLVCTHLFVLQFVRRNLASLSIHQVESET
jgi:hypothetical protein